MVDNLTVVNDGNGNLNAQKLTAKTAKIRCSGNGSAQVNVSGNIDGKSTGNGNITNIGEAKF